MNSNVEDPIDLSDAPKCPEDGFGLFPVEDFHDEEGDWKCLGCGETYDDEEVEP